MPFTVPTSKVPKEQLTDATLFDTADVPYLDTAANEHSTRFKTVRSWRHAMRRLIGDAGSGALFLRTLAGAQVSAMLTEALTTPVAASEYVDAVNAVVTGAPADAPPDVQPASLAPSHNWKTLLSAITVLYTDGKYYIDDIGLPNLYRPAVPASPKEALRRVISESSTDGVYYLNTMSGKAMRDINDLTAGGAVIGDITTVFTTIEGATTTASSTVAPLSSVNMASIRQMFGKVLRKNSTTATDRTLVIDDVGVEVVDVTQPRYSFIKTWLDLARTDGGSVRTYSGAALAAIAALVGPTPTEFIEAVEGAVVTS